ncbi:MAG TPA: hypothetical protein VK176_11240 [Phycisphaerales bacterium]|nr:hypothetical protein [Phycisphaerales bacterium]
MSWKINAKSMFSRPGRVLSVTLAASVAGIAAMAGGWATASSGSSKSAETSAMKYWNCLTGISKDACEGFFGGGFGYIADCATLPYKCSTLEAYDVNWSFKHKSSGLRCRDMTDGKVGVCDENEKKSGKFDARVNYELRQQGPCRYRGHLNGQATWYGEDGSVYQGQIVGVIGTGAERYPNCTGITPEKDCENCLEVTFDESSDPGIWNIGVEAIFTGTRVDNPNGETMTVDIQGWFRAKGDKTGPFDPINNGFVFEGTADGVLSTPC